MFKKLLHSAELPNIRTYLERHIEVDSGVHSILGQKLICEICKDDTKKWDEVEQIAKESIEMRILLWDGVYNRLN